MNKLVFAILALLLLAGTVFALPTWWVYDSNIDSYSGQIARDRRIYDPYTRQRYFGEGYMPDYTNFGAKGPTSRMTNTGAKSAYSGVFNLDTNALSNQGRDPGHISNWDPNIRGYSRMDNYAYLLPFDAIGLTLNADEVLIRGTARVLSVGDAYGSGLNMYSPKTQVFVTVLNLPPADEETVYHVWLFDHDTEYALDVGILKPGGALTASLYFEFRRKVDMFESVMITREPFYDSDPGPGEVILWGDLGPIRNEVNPPSSWPNERLR